MAFILVVALHFVCISGPRWMEMAFKRGSPAERRKHGSTVELLQCRRHLKASN